jgi:hypothetical protein
MAASTLASPDSFLPSGPQPGEPGYTGGTLPPQPAQSNPAMQAGYAILSQHPWLLNRDPRIASQGGGMVTPQMQQQVMTQMLRQGMASNGVGYGNINQDQLNQMLMSRGF